MPNVTLQILPLATGPHVGAFGPFHYFRFRFPELPDVVYTENLTGAAYLDQRPDVVAYLEALDRMAGQAQSINKTKASLNDLCKEW